MTTHSTADRCSDYSPYGAFEQKAKYQSNLLLGLAVNVGLVLCVGLALWATRDRSALVSLRVISPNTSLILEDEGSLLNPDRQRDVTVWRGEPAKWEGFAGFTTEVTAVPTGRSLPKAGKPIPVAMSSDPMPAIEAAVGERGVPISAPVGVGYDSGFPEIPTLFDRYAGVREPIRFGLNEPLRIFMREVEYPRRALRHRVSGAAAVRLVVSRDGELDTCIVVRDSPDVWGFGAALVEALQASFYDPAVERGQRTASVIQMTYMFVIDSVERTTVVSSDNVRVLLGGR